MVLVFQLTPSTETGKSMHSPQVLEWICNLEPKSLSLNLVSHLCTSYFTCLGCDFLYWELDQ
jgi:hypothetical protein